jgi:hypothetical protein
LDGRQKSTGIGRECESAPRANDVTIDQSLQSSAAGGDDSEFRQRKEAVKKDERGDDRQVDVKHCPIIM